MMTETTLPAFKDQCRVLLKDYNIGTLRAYARYIGVQSATTKMKKELIEDIICILSGERLPIEKTNRGAPPKNDYIDPMLEKEMAQLQENYRKKVHGESTGLDFQKAYREMLDRTTEFVFHDPQYEKKSGKDEEFEGQFETISGVPCLLPLSGNWKQEQKIVIPNEVIERYELSEGDVLICSARKYAASYVVTGVWFINGIDAGIIERVHF